MSLRDAVWKRGDGLLFLPRESEDVKDGRPNRQYLCRIAFDDCGLPLILWLDRHRTGKRAARGERPVPYEVEQPIRDFLLQVCDLCSMSLAELLQKLS